MLLGTGLSKQRVMTVAGSEAKNKVCLLSK